MGSGASDLHNTYLAINENLTDDEVDELIRLCDHDGDGQVGLAGMVRTHCNIIALSLARSLSVALSCSASLSRSLVLPRFLAPARTRAGSSRAMGLSRLRVGATPVPGGSNARCCRMPQVSYEEFRKMVLDFNKKAAGR